MPGAGPVQERNVTSLRLGSNDLLGVIVFVFFWLSDIDSHAS